MRTPPKPFVLNPTLVRRRPSLDFSVTGLVYCSMMMFMGLAAINSQANLLFGVFGLMIGTLLISGVVSRLVLRKLRVHRVLPKHGIVGEPMTLFYEITNGKRFWPSLSVSLAELDGVQGFTIQPHCYMLHAAPKMTASIPTELVPKRRGPHELNQFQLSTSFPFGFIKRALVAGHKEMVSILPALAEVDGRVLARCRSADNTGDAVRPRPGGMDEFYGLKEFRQGDNPRGIYWRRSARTGVLVSKEMTRVSPPKLAILVDTHMGDRSLQQHALIERTIAMAASLASSALEQELSVGVCAWSKSPISLPPSRGKQQRDEILTLLAQLPVNTTFDSARLLEECHGIARAGTTLVLVTPRNIETGVPDRKRSSLIVLSAVSDEARGWFKFRPGVNFETCMPVGQEPLLHSEAGK